jgi:hypothetical protein
MAELAALVSLVHMAASFALLSFRCFILYIRDALITSHCDMQSAQPLVQRQNINLRDNFRYVVVTSLGSGCCITSVSFLLPTGHQKSAQAVLISCSFLTSLVRTNEREKCAVYHHSEVTVFSPRIICGSRSFYRSVVLLRYDAVSHPRRTEPFRIIYFIIIID